MYMYMYILKKNLYVQSRVKNSFGQTANCCPNRGRNKEAPKQSIDCFD